MTSGAVETCSAEPAIVEAQYETLRMAGLGEALPPEARSGLVLFLRRGMWGWARTLAVAAPPPSRPPSARARAPHESRGVIHVFAAMAMNAAHHDTRGGGGGGGGGGP
jgi:hypothetical protein